MHTFIRYYLIIMVIVSTFHTVHAKRTAKNFTQKKALIIGNYKYRDRSYHLRTPKQDVRELKRTLKKAGFTVQVKENLSAYEMEKALFLLE